MITLRMYHPDDAPALLELFKDTVRRVNCRDYPPGQIAAWSSEEIDRAKWAARFAGRHVLLAEAADGRIAGFGELEPDGHIDRFFISADHHRKGIGRQLMTALQAEARRIGLTTLRLEGSITARPFFERMGFETLARQSVPCRGTELVNFRMEMRLSKNEESGTATCIERHHRQT